MKLIKKFFVLLLISIMLSLAVVVGQSQGEPVVSKSDSKESAHTSIYRVKKNSPLQEDKDSSFVPVTVINNQKVNQDVKLQAVDSTVLSHIDSIMSHIGRELTVVANNSSYMTDYREQMLLLQQDKELRENKIDKIKLKVWFTLFLFSLISVYGTRRSLSVMAQIFAVALCLASLIMLVYTLPAFLCSL